MIPSVLARQIRQGVEDFLKTTFPVTTPFFHGVVDRLLNEPNGVFRGPYLTIQLPFRQGESGKDFFPDIPLQFNPYLHQEQAFRRLSGDNPRSTIVATGTGSGKTESFLYPILDYCYRHRGRTGIKAILIYPMNALASDQAGRIARIIWNSKLKGHVVAGLFVGDREKTPRQVMDEEGIITDKDTLRLKPPDILLTNYKMLDYLLIRQKDFPLWKDSSPDVLRYLVVDELHTFDGAQGTDLACLTRRLKVRLKSPANHLCCVGTSATLGSEGEQGSLRSYAETVFGEPFDEEAIINENRQTAGEFLEQSLIARAQVPSLVVLKKLRPESYAGHSDYVRGQYHLWFDEQLPAEDFEREEWRVNLTERLNGHLFFQNLLKVLRSRLLAYDEILEELRRVTPELRDGGDDYGIQLLNSLVALVSEARIKLGDSGGIQPFLHVRLQLWMRELRRMVGSLTLTPHLRFADDLKEEERKNHLPIVHCRDCGSMGWAGVRRKGDPVILPDLRDFYISFFRHDAGVVFLFPGDGGDRKQSPEGDYHLFCGRCLRLKDASKDETCSYCGNGILIPVFVPDSKKVRSGRLEGVHHCPYCGSNNGLTIVGSQAASLTSVMIDQLYASGYNDDKKLLTFSDSVQDAAHRAGFFGARTFRFNLRTALQQYVNQEGEGLSLAEAPEGFSRYWSEKKKENDYIATFLPPDMAWLQEYDHLTYYGSLPDGAILPAILGKRLSWEIFSEYAFRSRIGRTLEKTGSSIVYPDLDQLNEAQHLLLEILRNEIGELRELDGLTLRRFLIGFIVHLKDQGAVFHEGLRQYVESLGNTFLISRIPWMPSMGPFVRHPIFLTHKTTGNFDTLINQSQRYRTWYQAWMEKCFAPVYPLVGALAESVFEFTLKVLIQCGILGDAQGRGAAVWGLLPQALRISNKVRQYRCRLCGHQASMSETESESWDGAPCLRFYCTGTYAHEQNAEMEDYYSKLYTTGHVQRIFPAEHTGLLSRDEREVLEAKFKAEEAERKPWDPNLLSCTPTLELGIDIGDLSSVILCSVPPGQANYIQRVGRAGRRDGNALALTVANGRPHDLYFYSEPKEMLAGKIDVPGIFLAASAVLERQLTAFCLDRWVETDLKADAQPPKLGPVLNNLESNKKHSFPHNFLSFINGRQEGLLDAFISMFDPPLDDETISQLRTFMKGGKGQDGSLAYRIAAGLSQLKKERDTLRKKVRYLSDKIRKLEKDPAKSKTYDKDLSELICEKGALQQLIVRINDRDLWNFMTDEGLIPNYAFPQAGVLLRSVIYRKKDKKEGKSGYDHCVYEYERPAVSAISELAPANRFYAGGRKVTVDQIDLSISEQELWRFCSNCTNLALVGQDDETVSCPRCGSLLWSDEGRKRQMIRMKQVVATTSDRKSRIEDDSDDRNPLFYNKQMFVYCDNQHITDAYRLNSDEFPFGFEFLSRAAFREINFGEKGESGEKVCIAGIEIPRRGFTICRHCGKVQDEGKNEEFSHALTCTARNLDADQNFTDCIYLYREFSSEAIRMLLPVTTFAGSEKRLHSFIAALQLGLRKKYGGNIDHLQTTIVEEPVQGSSYRKKYLVLYDTVPGGTGYLKQLMRSQTPLLEVFALALDVLQRCSCHNSPEKDGCYRCLYVFRNSYDMEETSRDTAIDLLEQILANRDNFVKIDTLDKISVNGLFDSELEAKFIEALQKEGEKGDYSVSLTKELVNGKPGYFMQIGERCYYIEPQVKLGPSDGVDVPSKADFMFYPARPAEGEKPIAIFTDGYLYHRDRVAEDMAQRMAIAQSGNFHVWSLTWKDVENRFHSLGDSYYVNYLDPSFGASSSLFIPLMEGFGLDALRYIHQTDSFTWLIRFFNSPEKEAWQRRAMVHGLIHLNPRIFSTEQSITEWKQKVAYLVPEAWVPLFLEKEEPVLYGLFESKAKKESTVFTLFAGIEQGAVNTKDISAMAIACVLNDNLREESDFEAIWNGYLRLYNLLQFLPQALFVTDKGMSAGVFSKIKPKKPEKGTPGEAKGAWDEVRELSDPSIHPLLARMAEMNWPVPIPGYELTNSQDVVVATAELAWPDQKVAFLTAEEQGGKSFFTDSGWAIHLLEDFLEDPEKLQKIESFA